MQIVNVADLINPDTGNTYREDNANLTHNIPLGTLVEVVADPESPLKENGLRLFVVKHGRDCDQTPLYYLSHKTYGEYAELLDEVENANAAIRSRPRDDFARYQYTTTYWLAAGARSGGWPESSLAVVRPYNPDEENI